MNRDRARERREAGKAASARIWLTVYGDLITNLMLFFLLLFANTRLTGAEQTAVQEAMDAEFASLEEELVLRQDAGDERMSLETLRKLEAELMKEGITIVRSPDETVIRLPSGAFFASGSAAPRSELFRVLNRMSDALRVYPRAVIVEGHTDDVPLGAHSPYRSNWELSFARAQTVIDHLTGNELEIDPRGLVAIGRGEYRPVVPNDSPEHRAQNRRIEIKLHTREVAP